MRTQEEIKRQVDGLLKMKEWLPPYSMFGDPNHEEIDAQVSILNGEKELDDFEEGDWSSNDETNKIYIKAQQAESWLNQEINDDIFEEE